MNKATNDQSLATFVPDRDRCLGIMAKHWVAGQVKTRLAKKIGDHEAAQIHRRFTVKLAGDLSGSGDQRCVFVAPDDAVCEMRTEINDAWAMSPQGEGDLGQRMMNAFRHWLSPDHRHRRVILIGADLPTLDAGAINHAFEHLAAHDVVLGPAIDGGYYLIGLRGPWREEYERLFSSMPWSTDSVFDLTTKRVNEIDASLGVLAMREDIDTLESLQRLLDDPTIDPTLSQAINQILSQSGR